jgi:hypothetical protein
MVGPVLFDAIVFGSILFRENVTTEYYQELIMSLLSLLQSDEQDIRLQ